MAQEHSKKLEQPVDAQVQPLSGLDARIFTMPEQYRHGAQTALHQPEVKTLPKIPVLEPQTVPVKPTLIKSPVVQKKRSARKIIVLVGLFVLFILGIGGYLLIQSTKKEIPIPVVAPVPTPRPAPVKESEIKEPIVKESETKESEVFPVEIVPGVDSDSDGLSDIEETLVYKTDPRLPDTDSDGFLDGNEVFHRYNPGGIAPGTLLESGSVKAYKGTIQTTLYEFYYPTTWSYEEVQDEVVLDAQTGEGFHLFFLSRPEGFTFKDWIKEQFPAATFVSGVTKNGLPMMQSEDQRTVYLDLTSVILNFVYDPGIKTRVDYLQTFQMMLNSVQVVDVVENVENNSETSTVQFEESVL